MFAFLMVKEGTSRRECVFTNITRFPVSVTVVGVAPQAMVLSFITLTFMDRSVIVCIHVVSKMTNAIDLFIAINTRSHFSRSLVLDPHMFVKCAFSRCDDFVDNSMISSAPISDKS